MPIPALSAAGWLPEGIHLCTLPEIEASICSIPDHKRRRFLFRHLEEYLSNPVVQLHASHFIVDGSFVSIKPVPGDIDLVLALSPGSTTAMATTMSAIQFQREMNKLQGGTVVVAGRRLLHAFPFEENTLAYSNMVFYFRKSDRPSEPENKGVLRINLR